MNINFSEKYIASQGQKIFAINKKYLPNQGYLMVFVNGIITFPGINNDYIEYENNITFNYGLEEDDKVDISILNGINETYIATKNQRVFYTSQAYNLTNTININTLMVFVNGVLMTKNTHYKETNRYTITFLYDLEEEDKVTFITATGYRSDVISSPGERIVTFSKDIIGPNIVSVVTVNGVLCREGTNNDYIIKSNKSIEFTYDLENIDYVDTFIFYRNNNFEIIPSVDNPVLFNKYGSNKTLYNNNLYNITLKILDQDFSIKFNTKYDTMYTTYKIIKTELRNYISDFSEEEINFIIYTNSKEGLEIYQNRTDYDSTSSIPSYLKNWTRVKTCYDLLYTVYYEKSKLIGSEQKSIGNTSITIDNKVPYMKDVIKKYSTRLDLLTASLTNSSSTVKYISRGITNYPYPVETNRNSF